MDQWPTRAKAIELLEEKTGINLPDLRFDNGFLDLTLKTQQKKKVGKLDFIKMKNICPSKDIIKNVKRQSTGWEKIFAKHIWDRGLIYRIVKNSYNSKTKMNNAIKKMGKGPERVH